MSRPPKYDWRRKVLPAAAAFVRGSDTGVTLRQCFYNLASRGFITNTLNDYQLLSSWTTEARDDGKFPDFIDNGRWVHRPTSFASPDEAFEWLTRIYRRDRTEFAKTAIYLGVEKMGLVAQLEAAFGDLGLPILPLGGWASQTFRESVRREIEADGRPAVLIYAGDFDPAGILIGEQFADAVGAFREHIRIALNLDQLAGLQVSPFPTSKMAHSLIPRFKERYGTALVAMGLDPLVQFELDALPPATLISLYQAAINQFSDASAIENSLEQERLDLEELRERWA